MTATSLLTHCDFLVLSNMHGWGSAPLWPPIPRFLAAREESFSQIFLAAMAPLYGDQDDLSWFQGLGRNPKRGAA
ncbi:hypothetical protein GCM10027066_06810 [Dyella jejuensis]